MKVAIDQRHDRDAQAGHDEAGLFGGMRVLGTGQSAAVADRLDRRLKQRGDSREVHAVSDGGFVFEAFEGTTDSGVIMVQGGDDGSIIVGDRVHGQAGEIGQGLVGPLSPCGGFTGLALAEAGIAEIDMGGGIVRVLGQRPAEGFKKRFGHMVGIGPTQSIHV